VLTAPFPSRTNARPRFFPVFPLGRSLHRLPRRDYCGWDATFGCCIGRYGSKHDNRYVDALAKTIAEAKRAKLGSDRPPAASLRTNNAIERLPEELKRRIKTQTCCRAS
jgi:hypothetical protein